MTQMNKVMDPQKTMKTMQEFEKQNVKMEMTEEMSMNLFICMFYLYKAKKINH